MNRFLKISVANLQTLLERARGRLPRDFHPHDYLEVNPDVAMAGHSAVRHYLKHGRAEGREYKLGRHTLKQLKALDPNKKNILFVSHEASRTGAPIVCLKLIQALNKKYNIICLLLGPGDLEEDFENSVNKLYRNNQNNPGLCLRTVKEIVETDDIYCAVVNSVVSIYALEAICGHRIPTLSLIHEFTTYVKPHSFMEAVIRSSSEIVYSAEIIKADAVRYVPRWRPNERAHIIPQGRCILDGNPEKDKVDAAFQPNGWPNETKVIIGAGSFNFRKGVEFFLQTCSYILKMANDKNLRFVWFGNGYDPENDFEFSLYFKEQIVRSGLEQHIQIVGNIGSLEYAYNRATAFLLTSRLDPLPNVGLDAICHGLPIFCFADASGVADVLEREGLADLLVSPHLESYDMAQKVVKMLEDSEQRERVSGRLREIGRRQFSMERYARDVDNLIDRAVATNNIDKELASKIAANDLVDMKFWNRQPEIRDVPKPNNQDVVAWQYVREVRSGVDRRKLREGVDIFKIAGRDGISVDEALNRFSGGKF
ncbi:glycosyltransferase family 4 protein [Agrobacterium fabrum]|uniref:glycosyltransferase family 4 protein n=1 Tax=Agrobacterium fabrum TaxID=1176649 RepID=UPI002473CDA6|nr:glycosyltransferase family 4 protein [Agrobacterium fabrum]MDH6296598.1 glycosyltransferase involved in cell wall biosynthesis [Agrobacterium fabrum]